MELTRANVIDLLVLRLLPSAVRCTEIGGGPVTLRRKLPCVVPGQRLTVNLERRWRWRHSVMLGGEVASVDFSLRALRMAGHQRPLHDGHGIVSPGDRDPRLREGLLEFESGNWITARCLLLEMLESTPGNLLAHATLGAIHRRIEHGLIATAHLTVAIRLGLGALVDGGALPVDPRRETERALLGALLSRASLLAEGGREDAAAGDLRRALSWDPSDALGASRELERLCAEVPVKAM